MTKYNCAKCTYETNRKSDYTRHTKSKKHLRKVQEHKKSKKSNPIRVQSKSSKNNNKKFVCMHCNNEYSSQCNLTKHMKKCVNMELVKKDKELQNIKNENILDKVKMLEKENERLHKQVDTFADLLKSSMSKTTGNTLTYIVNNYASAPQLKCLPSYKHILDADTMTLPQVLIMYHQDNTLCRFIGEFLVKAYAKKDGNNQSMWSSDTSRLTYIINELQESGKIQWVLDKKGIKIKKYVINPLLQYLKKEIADYIDENSLSTERSMLIRLQAAIEIYNTIDKDILANGIVRYMAPYFTLMKEDKKLLKN